MARKSGDTFSTRYWWKSDPDGVVQDMVSTVEHIMNEQDSRRTDYIRYASFYKDKQVQGFEPGDWRVSDINLRTGEVYMPITYNVIRSATDTVVSKISLNKPAPRFLTEEGSEKIQQKAKKLEKFVEGVMYASGVQECAVDALRDACIYGFGLLKIYESDDEINVEKVHPTRIVVDDNSALNGDPRSMFQKEYISREALLNLFPKAEKTLYGTKLTKGSGYSLARDMVEVYEGWHLPCGKSKGRHVICVEGGILLDEEWKDNCFPFVIIRWSKDIMGWHGIGLAEELEGIQTEIDELLNKIRNNMRLLSVPFVLKHRSSDIHDQQLMSNKEARLIEYSGNIPPKIEIPPAVHPQVFQQLDALYNKAFEIAGVSQLSATSKKPAGVESGIALRTLQDVETQRFSTLSRQWEEMFVDIAKKIVACARRLAEGEGLKVRYTGKNYMETLDWKDVDMHEDMFVLKVYPASSLPNTPAGKLETVIDMMKAGLITPDVAGNLLEFPDLDKYFSLMNSAMDDIEATFEHMLATGQYVEPLPYQNLQLGIKLGTHYYLRAKLRGESEAKLDLVLRWLADAADILAPPEQEWPMMEQTVAGAAGGMGPTVPPQEMPSPMAGIPGASGVEGPTPQGGGEELPPELAQMLQQGGRGPQTPQTPTGRGV